jgi:hypothetical protein
MKGSRRLQSNKAETKVVLTKPVVIKERDSSDPYGMAVDWTKYPTFKKKSRNIVRIITKDGGKSFCLFQIYLVKAKTNFILSPIA